jgi:ribosomal-protein-alanine N-acetyltransferase
MTMLPACIRWLVHPDIEKVLAIEEALPNAWTAEEFCHFLHHRNSIGMVIEVDGRIVGYMAYELCPRHLEVIRLVVHPHYRRQGIGRQLIARLATKLTSHRRNSIALNVSEWETGPHLWLKACGFEAIRVVPGRDEDCYRFVLRSKTAPAETVPVEDMVWL